MKILFLTLVYPQDEKGRGIYVDLINELTKIGNEVTVVTPLERRYNKPTNIEIQGKVRVLRVKMGNIQKTNIVEKGISTILLESKLISAIKMYLKDEKFDLVIYSTPPITFEKVIRYAKEELGAKSYLLLKDIFPQNAVDIGMIKNNSFLYNYFRKKEEKLYKLSDYIGCMSQQNVNYLISNNNYIDKNKVEVSPNCIKPLAFSEIIASEKSDIREKYGISGDKKVIIYGGNLGKPQGIDFLIKVLESNLNNEDIFWLIIGGGTEYDKLYNWINSNRAENIKLYSMLPKSEYDNLVKSCDIGLILLDYRFTIPNFPSRVLSYMEAGIPVLAATDKNTDFGDVIEKGGFGRWTASGDVESFNVVLNEMISSDKNLIEMGKLGYEYLVDNYNVEKQAKQIIDKFND